MKPRPETASAPAAAARPDPEAELALLSRAEHALETAPETALALLDEHARRFPYGVLVQEREVMRIDAERALGRLRQAAAHARAFVARFPHSPHRHRFEAWLNAPEADPGAESAAGADHAAANAAPNNSASQPIPTR